MINLSEEQVKNIIDFYLIPNSQEDTKKKFNLSQSVLNKILQENNIKKHSKEICNKLRQQKYVQTCLEKYGTNNVFAAKEVKDKIKETCLEKYGTGCYQQTEEWKNKYKNTCQEKYGVNNIFQVNEIKQKIKIKIKETLKDKYNVDNVMQLDETKNKKKQTCLERFGVDSFSKTQEWYEKTQQTCLERFGSPNYLGSQDWNEKTQQTCLEHFGTFWYTKSDDFKQKFKIKLPGFLQKQYQTKKKNNSFNVSKPENLFYESLLNKFNTEDIIRQYKDERYPFMCDFYIKSLDLFIELNLMWTHGGGEYIKSNLLCEQKLNFWKEKAKKSNFYKNAIETWTVRDKKKLDVAKKNNLNYLVFYTEKDAQNWILNFKKEEN